MRWDSVPFPSPVCQIDTGVCTRLLMVTGIYVTANSVSKSGHYISIPPLRRAGTDNQSHNKSLIMIEYRSRAIKHLIKRTSLYRAITSYSDCRKRRKKERFIKKERRERVKELVVGAVDTVDKWVSIKYANDLACG